jgi:hypothetical protein
MTRPVAVASYGSCIPPEDSTCVQDAVCLDTCLLGRPGDGFSCDRYVRMQDKQEQTGLQSCLCVCVWQLG